MTFLWRWWLRARVITTAFTFVAGLVTAFYGFLSARWFAVEVAGDSMLPALEAGEWLLVRRGFPPRGDAAGLVVVAHEPGGRLLLKRVVGLPGELVELREGRVHIDGRALEEPHAVGATHAAPYRDLARLDREAYYLLGDQREASTDSRDHGGFRASSITGVARYRYWPPRRVGRIERASRRYAEGLDPR